jgi:hypothetical protein
VHGAGDDLVDFVAVLVLANVAEVSTGCLIEKGTEDITYVMSGEWKER